MSETMIQLAERVRSNEFVLQPDNGEEKGDLYYITKYLKENNIHTVWASRARAVPDAGEFCVFRLGNNEIHARCNNRDEIKAVVETIFGTETYRKYVHIEENTEHTLFMPEDRGGTPSFWENMMIYVKGPEGSRKLPVIHADIRGFYPEEFTDDQGDFKYTIPNAQQYLSMRNTRGDYSSNPYNYCNHCRNQERLTTFQQDRIKAFRRKDGFLYAVYSCRNCDGLTTFNLSPVPGMYIDTHCMHRTFLHAKVSSRYYVCSKLNGAYNVKLKCEGMTTNHFPWTNQNWGQALLSSVKKYAEHLDVPLEA
jgi:hypothetical protein